ncbi:MAG: glycosyltransferase family 4 protein, partial [Candidatus Omnitrophota bacterium]|nr:glycosyltransferase family 4 protein [Candidatus Omnitrophota bacterium]
RSVIAGNNYLKDFALQFNKNAVVMPSSVDTEKYKPVPCEADKSQIVIGWIGSNTTETFLYDLEETFVSLSDKYKNLVFKIVGAKFQSHELKNVVNKEWALSEELSDLQSFDIGIMPMPDNLWTKGKCGFKAILYMACGIPVVASPVGANLEIIDDGTSGFLARDNKEWTDKLSALIENASLREKIGKNAREKIIKKYSLDYTAPLFYEVLTNGYAEK